VSLVLSEHLPLLASAPNGIQKLRGLILELAVRGKLVPQDPDDEPASELLKRIAKERARLEAEGGCKKSKASPLVANDEQPFLLPVGWEWTRLGSLSRNVQYGYTASADHTSKDVLFLRITDIQDDRVDWDSVPGCLIPEADVSGYQLQRGDIVIARTGGTIGKSYLVENLDRRAIFASYLIRVGYLNGTDARYTKVFLGSSCYWSQLYANSMGTGQPNVNGTALSALTFPLPPLAEQHRIVSKVDELMALCDRLEAEQVDATSAHARLVETLLGALTQSTDTADLAANWQRLAEHFDSLFTTETSIDALKQTVLQLAVMGKLVPQNSADEPASELLKRITAMRALMESKGDCKKSKPLPPVDNKERHHSIPASWEYVRLQEVCLTITDGTHQTPRYTENGRPFLSAQNVKPFRFMPESFRYVSEEDYQGYIKTTKPEFGDVLLTRVGAMIGEAAVIDKRMDFAIYVSLGLLKPCQPFVSPEFITLWLNSPFGTHSSIRDTLGRGVSAGNLNLGMIRAFALPLPPIGEQQRIVSRAHELMALCDHLKANLAKAQQHQARLATTLIETALEAA